MIGGIFLCIVIILLIAIVLSLPKRTEAELSEWRDKKNKRHMDLVKTYGYQTEGYYKALKRDEEWEKFEREIMRKNYF